MREEADRVLTMSTLRKRWWSGLGSSDWREVSLSWVREQPITVWPRLANSWARARPNPLLTPVISTVRDTLFPIPLNGVVAAIVVIVISLPLELSISLAILFLFCLRFCGLLYDAVSGFVRVHVVDRLILVIFFFLKYGEYQVGTAKTRSVSGCRCIRIQICIGILRFGFATTFVLFIADLNINDICTDFGWIFKIFGYAHLKYFFVNL